VHQAGDPHSRNLSSNEPRVTRAFSQYVSCFPSDDYDPSALSSEDFEYFYRSGCVSDDAREPSSARDGSSPPLATCSIWSDKEPADSVYSETGAPISAQQNNFSGYNCSDDHDIPYSPIADPTHPWDETQQHSYSSTPVETTAGREDVSASRPLCGICNKSFGRNHELNRHRKTVHGQGDVYWACPVESCGRHDKLDGRKENVRRHCQTKHPTIDLKAVGL